MENNEIALLLYGLMMCILLGQMEASGNIGNRSFSIWYETHFLIEKKGICKLIYFKPRHFERYTLYEVVGFFASYLSIPVFAMLGLLCYTDVIGEGFLTVFVGMISAVGLLSMLAIAMINDIGSRKDENKRFYMESGERECSAQFSEEMIPQDHQFVADILRLYAGRRSNSYFTVYNLRDSYQIRLKEAKHDAQKRRQVHLDYIAYFRNIDRLVVVKENKSGSLQLRIKEQA